MTSPAKTSVSAKSKNDAPAPYISPALRITAKRHNHWCAGEVHSAAETGHEAGKFTERQIKQLKADPMLDVQELSPDAASTVTDPQS